MLFISFCFVKMSGELDWEEVQSLNCTFVQESQLLCQYFVVKYYICKQLHGVMKTTRLVKSLPASYKQSYYLKISCKHGPKKLRSLISSYSVTLVPQFSAVTLQVMLSP